MLPEPLLSYDLFDNFMDAAEIQDEKERIENIKGIKDSLPIENRRVVHRLMKHLRNVAAYSHVNKMTISNLAIVFAPTLLKGRNETMVQLLKNTPKMTTIVHHLIADYKHVFGDEDQASGGGDVGEDEEKSPGKGSRKKKEAELELVMIQVNKPLESLQKRIGFFRKKAKRPDEVGEMTFEQLKLEKKLIKKELRSYDQVFKYKNGRFPTKSEKEPLRPLYNRYRKVKSRFERLEKGLEDTEEHHEGLADDPGDEEKAPPPKPKVDTKEQERIDREIRGTVSRLTDDVDVQKLLLRNSKFKGLLESKRKLQKALKKYQKDFVKENGRKMKTMEDRAPMEESFQKYKTIKEEMGKITEKAKRKVRRKRGE